jgi:molecular chaperone GrpE
LDQLKDFLAFSAFNKDTLSVEHDNKFIDQSKPIIDEDDFDISQEQQESEELDQETVKLKEEVDKTREQLMRALAEVENIRRIAKRDIGNAHKYALKPFIESLLPVMDSF